MPSIQVTVLSAANLPNIKCAGTLNPYVKLRCGSKEEKTYVKQKTTVKKGTLNPVWNETYTLELLDGTYILSMHVKDSSRGRDRVVGTLAVGLHGLRFGVPMDIVSPLDECKVKNAVLKIRVLSNDYYKEPTEVSESSSSEHESFYHNVVPMYAPPTTGYALPPPPPPPTQYYGPPPPPPQQQDYSSPPLPQPLGYAPPPRENGTTPAAPPHGYGTPAPL